MELSNTYRRVAISVASMFNETHTADVQIEEENVIINRIEDYPGSHFTAQCYIPSRNTSLYIVFHDYETCETTVSEYLPTCTKVYEPFPDTHTLED